MPEVVFAPDQPPLAMHVDGRDAVHESCDVPPAAICAGDAEKLSVGAAIASDTAKHWIATVVTTRARNRDQELVIALPPGRLSRTLNYDAFKAARIGRHLPCREVIACFGLVYPPAK